MRIQLITSISLFMKHYVSNFLIYRETKKNREISTSIYFLKKQNILYSIAIKSSLTKKNYKC